VARRDLDELLNVPDPAWPWLSGLIANARADVVRCPGSTEAGAATLVRLQVSAASTLGALVLHCGGLLIDRGWLRMLGSGCTGLPDLATANGLHDPESASAPGVLTVAYDVLGGRFAINGGDLPAATGEVVYWGPDTLDWTPIGGGHSAFVPWALGGGLADFYQHLRWPGWQDEVSTLTPDFGIAVYPPLFSVEGRDPSQSHRRVVPIEELPRAHQDMAEQIKRAPPGTQSDGATTDD
jgi:Protein of unknown function DUF2625